MHDILFVNIFKIYLLTVCIEPSNLPPLKEHISCQITDKCTEIQCCLLVERFRLSLNVLLEIDTCNNKFIVGVDKFIQSISLLSLEYGNTVTFSFMGLVRIQ